jgi:gamma-glutamyl hercynylcysteine S-oxide hydrolase
MCRLAAYLGPDLLLHKLLQENPNSLLKQSWASEELSSTTLNVDGFGFGWYLADGKAAIYTSTQPIWSDSNLTGLEQSLQRNLWLAYVRSATPGQATSQANTQPFKYEQYLFQHNGRIKDFNMGPRARLHQHLSAEIASEIEGNTDSEYLFALCKQHLRNGCSVPEALKLSCDELNSLLEGAPALVNIIISDGESLFICRHALNEDACPSLYYTNSHPSFPGGVLIASERFSMNEYWQEVDAHSLLSVNRRGEIVFQPL